MQTERRVLGKHAAAELQLLLDALPYYVLLVDEEHNIVKANQAVASDLGVSPHEVVGRYCPKAIHGTDTPYPGCPLEEATAAGRNVEAEFYMEEVDQWVQSAVYATTWVTEQGKAIYFHTTQDITPRKTAQQELIVRQRGQELVNRLLSLRWEELSREQLLERALNELVSLPTLAVRSEGCVFLVDEEDNTLAMTAQRGLSQAVQSNCRRVPIGTCICGKAAATRELVFCNGLDQDHEIMYEGISDHGHYAVPILSGERLLGVINIYLEAHHQRQQVEENLLRTAADVLGTLIERKHAREQLENALDQTMDAVGLTTEMRDAYTAGHQHRVAQLAVAIGHKLNVDQQSVVGLHAAAVLHDIGKIAVPAEILSKPSRLTDAEFSLIKQHPRAAYDILRKVEFPWPLADIVLQHHERLDGSGYPNGLEGDDILLEARILGVADVVEAMASHRPYRPGLGIDAALDEIRDGQGVCYDRAVVEACLRAFEDGFRFGPDD